MQYVFMLMDFLMRSATYLQIWITNNPFTAFGIIAVILGVNWSRDFSAARTFLLSGTGYTVIDGKFSDGKTRFLTLTAQEAKKRGMFVICNYFNAYEDVRWNTKGDLIRVLKDLWLLGEYQNYSEQEIRDMYAKEWKARVMEKVAQMKRIAKRYKHIPRGGFHSEILLEGDEMQNIFFSRDSVGNFSGENKPLLSLLHQVRHFNTRAMFALTDVSEFDKKFRRISSYYVNFSKVMGDLFIKYDVFTFETDKEKNFDIEMAKRLTKTSVWKLNGYAANKVITKLETLIRKRIRFRFKELGFYTKFNCDPDTDVYPEGKIFEYLNDWYESHPFGKRFEFSD